MTVYGPSRLAQHPFPASDASSGDSVDHAPRVIECPECGNRSLEPSAVAPGSRLRCARCGATLRHVTVNSLDRVLALCVAGLILTAAANLFPFITMTIQGRQQTTDLISGAIELYDRGFLFLAALVLATTVVVPVLRLGSLAIILIELRLAAPWHRLPMLCRWVARLQSWAMVEVYMLGVLVAYVKLLDLATIQIGPGVYALTGLMLVIIAVIAELDEDALWEAVEHRGLVRVPAPSAQPLARCSVCGLVGSLASTAGRPRCARCGAILHRRHHDSLSRCAALALAAAIFYLPANVFPVMTVISFGKGDPATIVAGVEELISSGMWPLALLVFFASITVPVLKLVGLAILLLSTKQRLRTHLHDRTVLYRVVERVGRWSMIDIFMLSILVALVNLGALATIEPGLGATCFAAVVVLTMFAAEAFDPRLMWDAAGLNDE